MLLTNKKIIINSKGEREELNICSTDIECKLEGEPHKIVKLGNRTGYIGLTPDLDTPKASSKRVKIGDKIYAERKYINKTFPENLTNVEIITQDMVPDLSDIDSMYGIYWNNKILKNADVVFNTINCFNFIYTFREAKNLIISPSVNTSKSRKFDYMYYNCTSLKKASDIDFSSITADDINTKNVLISMFRNCNSLTSVTFNNVPQGISEERIRSATQVPSTCQIILNYRTE